MNYNHPNSLSKSSESEEDEFTTAVSILSFGKQIIVYIGPSDINIIKIRTMKRRGKSILFEELVSDCSLTPNEQFFSYIMMRAS